jgi:hypothetical protein
VPPLLCRGGGTRTSAPFPRQAPHFSGASARSAGPVIGEVAVYRSWGRGWGGSARRSYRRRRSGPTDTPGAALLWLLWRIRGCPGPARRARRESHPQATESPTHGNPRRQQVTPGGLQARRKLHFCTKARPCRLPGCALHRRLAVCCRRHVPKATLSTLNVLKVALGACRPAPCVTAASAVSEAGTFPDLCPAGARSPPRPAAGLRHTAPKIPGRHPLASPPRPPTHGHARGRTFVQKCGCGRFRGSGDRRGRAGTPFRAARRRAAPAMDPGRANRGRLGWRGCGTRLCEWGTRRAPTGDSRSGGTRRRPGGAGNREGPDHRVNAVIGAFTDSRTG